MLCFTTSGLRPLPYPQEQKICSLSGLQREHKHFLVRSLNTLQERKFRPLGSLSTEASTALLHAIVVRQFTLDSATELVSKFDFSHSTN